MPRQARKLSMGKIYHVMVRGNERKNIFLDVSDRDRFINTLYKKKQEEACQIYAYCLMDNHVHLVIKEAKDELFRIMKSVNTSYAVYFNKKYNRIGHVFQDRFRSEIIENESYLLAAIRYVHNNPVKAKLVDDMAQYKWSSYNSYIKQTRNPQIIERNEILEVFSTAEDRAIELFVEFSKQEFCDGFVDYEEEKFDDIGEENVYLFIQKFLNDRSQTIELLMNKNNRSLRDELIAKLKQRPDLSGREIANILGVDRNIVQRIKSSS